jgi:hypothetical protein
MNYLDTMETEYHDYDQAEINAQREQMDEEGWAEIEAEGKRIGEQLENQRKR